MRGAILAIMCGVISLNSTVCSANPETHHVYPTVTPTRYLLNDELTHALSVKDYGAIGNGVTDDTHAISATIKAVAVTGKRVVYFPPGDYLFTAPYSIVESNLWIIGSGNTTTLRYAGTTRGLVIGGGAPVSNVRLSGFNLAGNATSGGAIAGRGGITVDGDTFVVSNVTIEKVNVNNIPVCGIVGTGARALTNFRIENSDVNLTGEHGIYLSLCKGLCRQ